MFDSGVGGLSVLREIRSLLPHESAIYLADQRWAPYGTRTLDEVRDRATQVSGQLIDAGAKAVVVACNSASAAALHDLRATYSSTPFVGMEPAVKPAAFESKSGVVGVIATEATFQGELFASVVDRHANGVRILTGAAPGLVALIEDGRGHGRQAADILEQLLGPMLEEGMDTLVLGCTHYPFLLEAITEVVGDGVAVIDPAPAVARQVGRVLVDVGSVPPTRTKPGTCSVSHNVGPREASGHDDPARLIGTSPEPSANPLVNRERPRRSLRHLLRKLEGLRESLREHPRTLLAILCATGCQDQLPGRMAMATRAQPASRMAVDDPDSVESEPECENSGTDEGAEQTGERGRRPVDAKELLLLVLLGRPRRSRCRQEAR